MEVSNSNRTCPEENRVKENVLINKANNVEEA